MTDHELPIGDQGEESQTESPQSIQPPRPPVGTHSRPFPSPRPDERRFKTPSILPIRPPSPPKPKPEPPPEQTGESTSERVKFPVAKPPPGIPPDPEPIPVPTPAHPVPVGQSPVPKVPVVAPDSEFESPTGIALEIEGDRDTDTDPAIESQPSTRRRGSLYGFVVYLALAIGTFPLPGPVRYVALWTLLIALGGLFTLFDEEKPLGAIDPIRFTWGAGVGFVLGLPIMLMASRALARTAEALIPFEGLPALFQAIVLTWPLGETLYYRSAVQREYGLVAAALTAALGNALLYWPEADGIFAVMFVAVIFATALAFVYSYVRRQYGLAAAFACQVMANALLVLVPQFIVPSV